MLLQGPGQHGPGVGRGADRPAVAADEGLEGGRRVHVGDRHHGVDVGHLGELLPGLLHRLEVGHVGHRAAGVEVGQDHLLVGAVSTSADSAMKCNEEWGLDFMHEYLMTKRKVRLLTIEDRFSREGLALDPEFSLTSRRVIRTLDAIAELRGYPLRLRVDNGPENVAGAMLQWSIDHGVCAR